MDSVYEISLRHLPEESFSFNIPSSYGENLLDDDDFLVGADDTLSTPAAKRVHEPLRLSELTPKTHRKTHSKPEITFPAVEKESLIVATTPIRLQLPPHNEPETRMKPEPPRIPIEAPIPQSTLPSLKPISRQKAVRACPPSMAPVTDQQDVPRDKEPGVVSGEVKTSGMQPPITLQAATSKEAELAALLSKEIQGSSKPRTPPLPSPLPEYHPRNDEPLTLSQLSPRKQAVATTSAADHPNPPVAGSSSNGLKKASAASSARAVARARTRSKASQPPPPKPRVRPIISKPVSIVPRPTSSSTQPRSKSTSEAERPTARIKKPLSATASTNRTHPPTSSRPESRESTTTDSDSLRKSKYTIPDFKARHAKYEAALSRSRPKVTPTVPLPMALSTDHRARERAKFDEQVKEREREMELEREAQRREREEEDEREMKELRRKAVPKAHEVPEWYKDAPRRQKEVGKPASAS